MAAHHRRQPFGGKHSIRYQFAVPQGLKRNFNAGQYAVRIKVGVAVTRVMLCRGNNAGGLLSFHKRRAENPHIHRITAKSPRPNQLRIAVGKKIDRRREIHVYSQQSQFPADVVTGEISVTGITGRANRHIARRFAGASLNMANPAPFLISGD